MVPEQDEGTNGSLKRNCEGKHQDLVKVSDPFGFSMFHLLCSSVRVSMLGKVFPWCLSNWAEMVELIKMSTEASGASANL